jgi:hypothetical protein
MTDLETFKAAVDDVAAGLAARIQAVTGTGNEPGRTAATAVSEAFAALSARLGGIIDGSRPVIIPEPGPAARQAHPASGGSGLSGIL